MFGIKFFLLVTLPFVLRFILAFSTFAPVAAWPVWSGIKPRNSRLATVAEFFNLKDRKMAVDASVWVRAMHGDKSAFKILSERCESDVRLTEKIYWKLLPFVSRLERYGA
ncbi:hypothetical protein LCGC14_2992210 [marine sediment metagenome]|uniref:Uncharacterized protein n=1 Tax=marine sediment metagenome TaxID=412755 RepID=A0A0F8XR26_9ZZZZ